MNNVISMSGRMHQNLVSGSNALAPNDRRGDRRNDVLEAVVGEEAVWVEAQAVDQKRLIAKRVLDIVIASVVLFLMAPLLLVVAAAVLLTSKGPVIFKQERVGLNGKTFTMFKFRTMVQNAEQLKAKLEAQNEMSGPVFKMRHHPRITKVGAFLRKSSLDEFPQLLNVVKGDMSLVGPRPPLMSEVKKYKRWQLERLSVKPGITCTWQVSGRNEIGFEDWMRMDVRYARSVSIVVLAINKSLLDSVSISWERSSSRKATGMRCYALSEASGPSKISLAQEKCGAVTPRSLQVIEFDG